MATPINSKQLLQQFLEGGGGEKEPVEEFPAIQPQGKPSQTPQLNGQHKKTLRFSITVPTPLALTIREHVSQVTVQNLIQGRNYSLSQFFCEAAHDYLQEKKSG